MDLERDSKVKENSMRRLLFSNWRGSSINLWNGPWIPEFPIAVLRRRKELTLQVIEKCLNYGTVATMSRI